MQRKFPIGKALSILLVTLFFAIAVRASICECDNDEDGKPDIIYGTTIFNLTKNVYAHYSPNGDTVKIASQTRIITNVVVKFADGSYSTFAGLSNDIWEYINPYHQIFGVYVSSIDLSIGSTSLIEEYLQNLNSADNPKWCNCIPLPFTLLNFQARKTDHDCIMLSWITATEINTSSFEIEKSFDGRNFYLAGILPGHGNSNNIISYTFQDTTRNSGSKVFYRLTQKHFNGNYEYSNVISIYNGSWNSGNSTNVYPNPITGTNIRVEINAVKEGSTNIEIYNLKGISMQSTVFQLIQGNNELNLDINGLKNGVYVLKCISSNNVTSSVLLYVSGR